MNQVLLPCGDISAIMGEVANIPSPCKSNVESALQKNELTNYNALLLATGVQQPIYSSGTEGESLWVVCIRECRCLDRACGICMEDSGGYCAPARVLVVV